MKFLSRLIFFVLLFLFIGPITGLLWLNFSPDPIAKNTAKGLNTHFDAIAKNPKKATTTDRYLFKGLYTGMYIGGKILFPEAASNLYNLFYGIPKQDQFLHSGYLSMSPTIRISLNNVSHNQKRWGSVLCAEIQHKQSRCALKEPESISAFATTDLRTFFLYNPWQIRVEESGAFRTIIIFQWMKFIDAKTPFLPGSPNPILIQDDLLELDGTAQPYTAYNMWIEPKFPTEWYMYASFGLRFLYFLTVAFSIPMMFVLLGWSLRNKHQKVYFWLYKMATFGLLWVGGRLLWDLCVDLSAVLLLFGRDSGDWVAYLRSDFFDVRPKNVLTQGFGGYSFAVAQKLIANLISLYICLQLRHLCKNTLKRPEMKILILVSMIIPVFGLPAPLAIATAPVALVWLWKYQPDTITSDKNG